MRMKHLLAVLGVVLAGTLVLATVALAHHSPSHSGGPPGGPPGGGGNPLAYTALGDSIAAGFGVAPPHGYVRQYEGHIENATGRTVDLTNLAVNGWTSSNLRNVLETDQRFKDAVSNAGVVTWNIGGNDFMNARTSYKNGSCARGEIDEEDCLRKTTADFKDNWQAIIGAVLSLRREEAGAIETTIIRTMNVYNPFVSTDKNADTTGDGTSDFDVFKPYIDDLNSFMCSTAVSHGIPCAGVYLAFNGPNGDADPGRLIGPDGIHPSRAGHALIADLLDGLGYQPLLD